MILDLKGNKLSQAPEFTANIGLSYNHHINDIGNVQARLDYYYSAEKYYNEFNNQAVQDNYELINARIGFESQDGVWDISLFGKNLTDELVSTGAYASQFLLGKDGVMNFFTPPRTYGVSVAYHF